MPVLTCCVAFFVDGSEELGPLFNDVNVTEEVGPLPNDVE